MNITKKQVVPDKRIPLRLDDIVNATIAKIQEKYFLIEKTYNVNQKHPANLRANAFVENAIDQACKYFNVDVSVFNRKTNERATIEYSNAELRYMVILVCRSLPEEPIYQSSIGKCLGMDHSSVVYGTRKAEAYIKTWKVFQKDYRELEKAINESLRVK